MENYPRTVEDAVKYLLDKLSEDDKRAIKSTSEDDLVLFHFGLGQSIRNEFGLWKDNPELLEACGTKHADYPSGIIIKALWERLRMI